MIRLLMLGVVSCALLPGLDLAGRVLVVYDSSSTDSLAVANHYLAARGIPAANLCATNPVQTLQIPLSSYLTTLRDPIRTCLQTLGPQNILYIVLAWVRPASVFVTYSSGATSYYSIDSYLSDIWDQYSTQPFPIAPTAVHRYYADSQTEGFVYAPFQSFATFRAQPRSQLIYSVWRLDGPTPTAASALVDQATQAMASGPTMVACIDRQNPIANSHDAGYGQGEWDLRRAAQFLSQGGVSVTEDENTVEFGTAPAPLTCPGAGFYSGWYSLAHYNDAFTWAPGAIGFHLDSASLTDPRTPGCWSCTALARGITVTAGSVAEPYLQGLPRPGGVFRNLLEGANVGDAFLRNTRWLKWMMVYVGDPLYRPFASATVFPPADSLSLPTRYLTSGSTTTARLTLGTPAPLGGVTIPLSISPAGTIPQNVFIAGGATSATFTVTTPPATVETFVTVTAATATPVSNTIDVFPMLGAIAVSPATVTGGQSATGSILLNASAPLGGVTVALSSDNAAVTVPPSVLVTAGTGRATFPITTSAVGSTQTATITASYAGATLTVTLTVN